MKLNDLWFRMLCALSRRIPQGGPWWRLRRYLYDHREDVAMLPAIHLRAGSARFLVSGQVSVNALIEGLPTASQSLAMVTRLLRPSARAFDIGANIGLLSVEMSRAVGEGGHVHAFEALRAPAELLRRNLVINGCTNVSVHEMAASNKRGEITFYDAGPGKTEVSSIRPRPGKPVVVPSITLDEFSKTSGPVDLIKIDVEGAEYLVLRGAEQLLRRDHPHLVIEVTDEWSQQLGARAADVSGFLKGLGYKMFVADSTRLKEVSELPTHQVDLLAIHDTEVIREISGLASHQGT